MIIIIGLGNPGEKYNNTPHNIGFEAIDFFAEKNNFPDFDFSKYSNTLISEKNDIILAKPQTFMNNSGLAAKKLYKSYEARLRTKIIVIHDDIDLPLGKTRISKNRGSAGHKGVESIIKELKTKDFTRIRIGISPEDKPQNAEKYVLKKFSKQNKEIAEKAIKEIKWDDII